VDAESVTELATVQTAAPPAYLSPEYVDLQVRFAERVSAVSGLPLKETLLKYTNFFRRMGMGAPGHVEPAQPWLDMVDGVDTLTHDARIERIFAALMARGDGAAVPLPGRTQFGCFACDRPDADGMVHIHFGNRVKHPDVGPLHTSRIDERRAELKAMFSWLANEHPGTQRIDGGSWLYNLEAYRRLFPPAFAASRDPRNGPPYLHGLSSWGQFIDFRARIREDVRDRFLAALPDLDMAAPHRVFPYQVLFTTAPFALFRAEYGV
jgi:hypothetical protein